MSKIKIEIGVVMVNYNDDYNAIKLSNNLLTCEKIGLVVIVNNGFRFSEKNYNKKIVVIQTDTNGGYAYGNNIGLKYLDEHYLIDTVIVINTDVIVKTDDIISLYNILKISDYSIITCQMLNIKGKVEQNYWHFLNYLDCIKECFYVFRKHRNYMLKDDCNIERCDVLRGSFMILKFSNFKEAGFFDCSTFLYFEEDKLCKKMEEKHFYRGIVKNIFYIHNHPYKKATIKATMVRHRRYYSSMLDYSKRYISKNVFLIFVLRVAICIGLFEKFLYTIFKSIFVQEKN